MKLLFCVLAGMFSLGLAAQKPFEGTIRYKVILSPKPDTVDINIFFGKNRTRLQVNNKTNEHSVILLTDLDSGLIHTLEAGSKTYTTRRLQTWENKPEEPAADRTILGRAIKGVILSNGGSAYMGLMGMAERAVAYPANDLLFPIPEKYEKNMELIFVHKGHILLGGEITINESRGNYDGEDTARTHRIFIEAQEIIPRAVDPALLRIPADYTVMERFMTDTAYALDSTAVMVDTAYSIEYDVPPPPPPEPQVKKAPVKKAAAKKPAAKTGTPGTKKQAARKPE